MKRRILALLMALVILLGSMPVQAFAAEELGMPIHFFVSTLEEAQDPYGDYENYKQSSWGSSNSTAGAYAVADILELAPSIATRQGIRAHMVEEDILKYVAQWPNGGTADDFRKFNGSIQIGRTNYSGDEYEVQWVTICKRDNSSLRCYCGVRYEHIHIDGILTKKIQITPGTMSLTKEISTPQSEDQVFTFKLYQLALDTNYDPTNEIIGSGTPMIATVPAGSTTATITPADPSATFGFGYYKLVEDPNSTWKQSGIRIGNGTNKQTSELYICIHTDGSVQYSTSYNTGYQTADNATVVNTLRPRADIKVTKVWDDANNQDGIRPESIQVHLLKNDAHLGSPVTLNAANNWTATWNVPLEDENGNSISYHVEEVVPNGYTNTVTGNVTDGFVLTNTHVVERTNVQTQKVWHDDSNRDGLRPYGVVVQLYKNGEAVTSYTDSTGKTVSGTATLTESVQWAHQWLDLEKNTGGTANAYTVKEIGYVDANGQTVANPGYTAGYSTDETGRLVVENTHQSATMDIPVQKVWSDANNQDGIRPASVTISLYANGTSTGKTLTLNATNNWKGTFEDVYVNSTGTPVVYSIAENTVAGYETAITGTAAAGFTVTNTHTPETVSIPVNKVWNDAEDQDGLRPHAITVALYADGVATGETLELNESNNWTSAFTGKAKFKAGAVGAAIVYTVQETVVPTGYTVSYNGTTITNTHTPETANLTVKKVWNDANNQDGNRPAEVTVTLHANGQPVLDSNGQPRTVTLSAANNWTGVWANMPRYHGGQRISYTVVETVPTGYTPTYSYDYTNAVATVTNSYTPETTSLNVQKVWDDDDNREGKRPGSVTVTLYQQVGNGSKTAVTDSNGTPITAVLSPANEWDADFTNLPKYSNGTEIAYSVEEAQVAGYEVPQYAYDAATKAVVITNKLNISKDVTVTAHKDWVDDNNQDGIRPGSVTLTLYANGIKTSSTITLDGTPDQNGETAAWTATWTGLYRYYRGQEIYYTVVEETVPNGYSVSITGSNNSYTVTNTHTPETVSVPVTKVWKDANDQDGKRPDSVTVELYANGVLVTDGSGAAITKILNSTNNWTASFDALPKYPAKTSEQVSLVNAPISYTVKEQGAVAVAGETYETITFNANTPNEVKYQVTYDQSKHTITNTYEPAKTDVTVQKVWSDSNNQDGKRPTSVTMHLLANGVHTGVTYKVTLTESTWTRYKLDAQQQEVIADSDNITDGTWNYTWTNLDAYKEGLKINYTVYEEEIYAEENGQLIKPYSAVYSYSIDANGNPITTVTNTRETDKTTFTAQKVWDDASNQDNIRPTKITVQLYGKIPNQQEFTVGTPIELTAEDHWLHTWVGLDKNKNAQAIVYTIKETTLPQGYTVNDTETGNDAHTGIYNLVNTHIPATVEIAGTKKWDDASNQDGKRPYGIELTLYRNGVAYRTQRITGSIDGDTWNYTFTDLPANHGIGIPNVYTVAETGYFMDSNAYGNASATPGIPIGYSSTGGGSTNNYTITNKHSPKVVSVTAHKEWDDGDDQDGKRPDEIIVALYQKIGVTDTPTAVLDAQGNPVTLPVKASNNWTATFDNLPKYKVGAVGTEVTYTVEEVDVPEGYTAAVSGNIITNTHTPETAKLNVQKVWDDAGNQDGKRPYAVVITLYQNGRPTTNALTLKASDSWAGYWENMPRYHGGQRISYTVVETGYYKTEADFNAGQLTNGIPEGYTVTHRYNTNSGESLATITNSYTPELTDLNVQKVWNDDDNRDGIRPQSLTVTLYRKIGANGTWAPVLDSNNEKVTAVMNPANEWDVSFTNLPKYSNGVEIIYNAVEETVPTGYTNNGDDYHFDPATRMVTITNTHDVARVDVSATKVWDDNNNQDGIRPEKVVLTLYANGIKTSSTITLDGVKDTTTDAYRETDAWKATWSNLLAYYHGQKIVYTVVEETVPAGYTAEVTGNAENGFTVTNSHAPALISIPVTKTWDDADNQDGIRPSEVKITLYADGAAIDTLTLKASENWMGSFGELPVNKNGTPIVYTVKEATTVGYTPAYSADTSVSGVQTMQVKNTHETYETKLTVTKVWDDNNDQDGKRPDSIVVHLLADGDHTGMKVTLTADMNWTYTWTGLDKYSAGQEIVYTVYEEPVYFKGISASGNARAIETYFASYAHNPEDATEVIITNTYIPETTIITAVKVWEDDGNRDDLRSEKVTVELYADGVATGKTLTLNGANNWEAAWENLPKYKDHGTAIVYSVVENNVPEGYTVTIAQESEYAPGLFIVSNVHSPALTNFTVSKVWNDDNNNDGIRPGAVTVTLMADGKALYTAQLSALSDWIHSWKGLYKYADGKEIKYTVVETAVDGYTASYKQVSDANGNAAWTVTNTHEIETAELVVTTVWVDDDNSQKTRPDEVPAQLYKDGKPYGDVFKIIVEEDWQKTIEVPVFEDGKEIVWTVEQVETPNPYTVTYNQGKLTIINTALFDDSPATGDASNPVLLVCLMTVSCAGIAAILILGRKKKRTDA